MNSKETSQVLPAIEGTENARDDILESLFSHASARKRAPEEDEQAIRASLHSEWMGMTRQRQRRKTVFTYAIAASVLLAAVISVNMLNRETMPRSLRAGERSLTGAAAVASPRAAVCMFANAGNHLSTIGARCHGRRKSRPHPG